ncbi:hydrolase, NUDIX family [Paraglaciecola polaris LMG 21857]|uniref:Hydrolase, NUDIX family n=1 Tax=Paraglaciecola polaris LMG 21857 TaxID=1129793 RepID=K6YQV7_9ALTE|nr:NUDIX hydrolase [Paraglaciecola polaris]GAC35119.1 hydrolase, NUDIX family [Paraglaciecola polaris LMG 21857]
MLDNNSNQAAKPRMIEALSIDNVVLGIESGRLMVLTAKYNTGLAQGLWGLLGGWVAYDEPIDNAAKRILKMITGVDDLYLEQFRAFGDVKRYPAERVVTIAYYALVRPDLYNVIPGGTASHVEWRDVRNLPSLIYDHGEIVKALLLHLKSKVRHEPIGFNLLPEKFTLLQLQEVYEAILDVKLDKPNFRRKILKMNLLIDCNEKQQGVMHRAASLYRFDMVVYQKLCEHGFNFEF